MSFTDRLWIAGLALFALILFAGAAAKSIECEPCVGWNFDISIAADEVSACVPAVNSPTATVLVYELQYDDGTTVTKAGDENCRIKVALYHNNRVRLRARFCNVGDCGPWSGWGIYASRLGSHCPADLDGNNTVDGTDFLLFREAFINGCQ